jgi:adenylate kinase family enzyme
VDNDLRSCSSYGKLRSRAIRAALGKTGWYRRISVLWSAFVRRVSVVGNSGSGKSTLARELAASLGVPHVELDSVFHQPGWEPLPEDEFQRLVTARAGEDGWVIDGNYSVVRPIVWARADTVVWLDLPKRTVMRQVAWRTLRRAVTQQELWNGNREPLINFLTWVPEKSIISWAWHNHAKYRTRYGTAAVDPANAHLTFIRLTSRADINHFLAKPSGALSGYQLGWFGDDIHQGAVSHDRDGEGVADRFGEHQPLQVLGGRYLLAAGGKQQVADAEARPVGRAAGHHRCDEQAGGAAAELRPPDRCHRRGHHRHAEVSAAYPAVAHQGRHDPPGRRVHRDGEPEPGPGDRGVDADDPRAGVGEGAARVTGVERRVRLDNVLDDAVLADWQGPAERAHHTCGDRASQSQGTADRDYKLAHPELVGLTEVGGRGRRSRHADDREVRQRVRAHDLERCRGAVGEDRSAAGRPADDVRIR